MPEIGANASEFVNPFDIECIKIEFLKLLKIVNIENNLFKMDLKM